jgi:hypothetical protein
MAHPMQLAGCTGTFHHHVGKDTAMDKIDSIVAPVGVDEHASTEVIHSTQNDAYPVSGAITLCVSGGIEMIKIAPDGFYVRGEKVKQDATEARWVYDAFVLFLKQTGCMP